MNPISNSLSKTSSAPSKAKPKQRTLFEDSLTVKKAKAAVMLERGATYNDIQAATGLARQTIANIVKHGAQGVPLAMIDALRSSEDSKLTLVMHKILDSVLEDDEVLDKASLQQRVTSAAILTDKRELLAGRPTARHEMTLSDDDIIAEIMKIKKELVDFDAIEVEAEDAEIEEP